MTTSIQSTSASSAQPKHIIKTLPQRPARFDSRHDFFVTVLQRYMDMGELKTDRSILVVGGTPEDKEVFEQLGFANVHLCNVDTTIDPADIAPFKWSIEDAMDLSFDDDSYDYVICHSMLHHLSSPHRGVCEMLRVAKEKIVAVDVHDGIFGRIAQKTSSWSGLSLEYEWDLPYIFGLKHGGVNDTPTPNYVYRWTRREMEKLAKTYFPEHPIRLYYINGWELPIERANELRKGAFLKAFSQLLKLARIVLPVLFPREGNLYACLVAKQDTVWPWLIQTDGKIEPNRPWYDERFKKLTDGEKWSGEAL